MKTRKKNDSIMLIYVLTAVCSLSVEKAKNYKQPLLFWFLDALYFARAGLRKPVMKPAN